LSTKIHVATDALGNPVRWQLTAGEVHDITQAPALVAGFTTGQVIADRGYDSDAFIACITAAGAQAVIPPRKTRREARPYDRHAYRERHLIECFFSRLKQFRRIATRYEKLARNFLSMLNLAMAYIWLA
jgi:transposase